MRSCLTSLVSVKEMDPGIEHVGTIVDAVEKYRSFIETSNSRAILAVRSMGGCQFRSKREEEVVVLWFQDDSEDPMCFLQLLGIPPFEQLSQLCPQ